MEQLYDTTKMQAMTTTFYNKIQVMINKEAIQANDEEYFYWFSDMIKDQIHSYDDLIALNYLFLTRQVPATHYHAGPIYDMDTTVLIKLLSYGIYTTNGQGSSDYNSFVTNINALAYGKYVTTNQLPYLAGIMPTYIADMLIKELDTKYALFFNHYRNNYNCNSNNKFLKNGRFAETIEYVHDGVIKKRPADQFCSDCDSPNCDCSTTLACNVDMSAFLEASLYILPDGFTPFIITAPYTCFSKLDARCTTPIENAILNVIQKNNKQCIIL